MAFRNIYQILQAVGVSAADIVLCHDYGDAACYGGSGQAVNDLSASAIPMTRGASSSSASDDPAFSGTAGNLSVLEKFTLDGGDFFRAAAVPAALDFIHQDNAKCTLLIGLTRIRSVSTAQALMDNNIGSSSNIGFSLNLRTDLALRLLVRRGTTTAALDVAALTLPDFDGRTLIAVTWDEAAGTGLMMENYGASAGFTSTYFSPSAAAASVIFGLFGSVQASTRTVASTEAFFAAIVKNTMTQAQIQAFFNEAGLRLGIAAEPEAFNALESGLMVGTPGGGSFEHGMI